MKLQQDIAYVKRALKGTTGAPRRKVIRSIIGRKKSLEDEERFGLGVFPLTHEELGKSQRNHSAIQNHLSSYGIYFTDPERERSRDKGLNSTLESLAPGIIEEENEQIDMATRLSLNDVRAPIPRHQGTATATCTSEGDLKKDKEAADILLLLQGKN